MPITDDAVLSLFGEIKTDIGRLGQKVDGLSDHVARQNGRIGKSEKRLDSIESSALVADTERATIVKVADKDRQRARDNEERGWERWQKVGLVLGSLVAIIAAAGTAIEGLHYIGVL